MHKKFPSYIYPSPSYCPETPPGILHPALGSPAGTCWSESRGGHKRVPRAGAPLLWRQAERAGVVQPLEGSGETSPPFPVPNEPGKELKKDLGQRYGVRGPGLVTSE